MPYINEEFTLLNYSYTTSRKGVLDTNETTYEYYIFLDNNHEFAIQADQKGIVNRGENYILSRSILFDTPIKLVHQKSGAKLTPPYDVYRIFGLIIPFVFLMQYLYFYRVKNYDLRLGLVAFMIIAVLMQILFGAIMCLVAFFVLIYKALLPENDIAWELFLIPIIGLIVSGFMAYALLRVGYEEIEN